MPVSIDIEYDEEWERLMCEQHDAYLYMLEYETRRLHDEIEDRVKYPLFFLKEGIV